jgi:hypothetical protein
MTQSQNQIFRVNTRPFDEAMRHLELIAQDNAEKVRVFILSLAVGEELSVARSTRNGLVIEPSSYLRGFLVAHPLDADVEEKLMAFISGAPAEDRK